MIYTLLADGFEEIEALAVVDILRRAGIEVTTVSVNTKKEVTGAHGITVISDKCLSDISDNYDMIFLPGGYPGYVNLEENTQVAKLLETGAQSGKWIAAICAAPSILGKLGLLRGKRACCFPGFEEHLKGADVSLDAVCTDGKIITSRGAGTAHELAFEIVSLFKGKDTASSLKNAMIYC